MTNGETQTIIKIQSDNTDQSGRDLETEITPDIRSSTSDCEEGYSSMSLAELVCHFNNELLKHQDPDDFLDQSSFPWITQIEENTAAVEADTQRLLTVVESVPPFGDIQELQRPLSGNGWKVFPFLVYGHRIDWSHEQFPATSELIANIPDCTTAMFSILQPGQRLQPHTGPSSAVLRYHLATFVPQPLRCGIRVAGQVRQWEQGKSLVLNDFREHEAWNLGDKPRVVLFIDFKRPVPDSLVRLRDFVIDRFASDTFSREIVVNFNQWVKTHSKDVQALTSCASNQRKWPI